MIKQTTSFSEKTGEVINIKREAFTDSMNEDGYRIPSHKLGARIFAEVQFPEAMTDSDIGKMTRLAKMMIAKNNMLGYRGKGKIIPYTAEEIGDLVGLKKRRSQGFVSKMIGLGIMCREDSKDETRYFINPAYFMANGQRLSIDMFIRFQKELLPILPKWVINEFLNQVNKYKDVSLLHGNFKNFIKQQNEKAKVI